MPAARHPFGHIPVRGPGVHFGEVNHSMVHSTVRDPRRFASDARVWAQRAHEILSAAHPEWGRSVEGKEVHVHFMGREAFARLIGTHPDEVDFSSVSSLEQRPEGSRLHVITNVAQLGNDPRRAFFTTLYELSANVPTLERRQRELEDSRAPVITRLNHDIASQVASIEAARKILAHPDLQGGGRYAELRPMLRDTVTRDAQQLTQLRAQLAEYS